MKKARSPRVPGIGTAHTLSKIAACEPAFPEGCSSLTDDQIAADKRGAAIHEAAHVVLTRKFGGGARAAIWPNADGGSAAETSWLGTTHIWLPPGTLTHLLNESLEVPPDALAIIGLAGAAAEAYDRSRDQETTIENLIVAVAFRRLSDTDSALIGDGFPEGLLENTVAHVASNWELILLVATELERFPEKERPSEFG